MHAHKEQPGLGVAELRGIDNIAAVIGQKTGDAMHDAALVETGERKDIFWIRHDRV
jgi:hypothetical protein